MLTFELFFASVLMFLWLSLIGTLMVSKQFSLESIVVLIAGIVVMVALCSYE